MSLIKSRNIAVYWLVIILSCFFKANATEPQNIYGGQFDFGGYYLTQTPHWAGFLRGYAPLKQDPMNVLFADIRGISGNKGPNKEGSIGIGHRKLYDNSKKMLGFYAFYIANATYNNTVFNQINVGTEYWLDHFFVGGNFYMPLGRRSKVIASNESSYLTFDQFGNIILVVQQANQVDVALVGGDVIFAFQPNLNFTSYAGYFYYHSATNNYSLPVVQGPLFRLRYSIFPKPKQLLSFLNEATLEGQVQYDKFRGTYFYGGIRLTLAFGGQRLSRMQQHMVDPILQNAALTSLSENINNTTQTLVVPN